jgi:hypothetical protein
MKTKYLVRFLNRAAQFEADLELNDVFFNAAMAGQLASDKYLFDYINPQNHVRLASRKVNKHNRELALHHLKGTLRAAFLKDIYEDVSTYITDLLTGAARAGLSPDRLIGEHKMSFEVNDILKCGNWEAVITLVAESLYRKLENERSALKLLNAINKKLNLSVPENFIQDALPYLEIRHLLVHSDGVADDDFCQRFPAIGATAGKSIELTYALIAAARTKITDMVIQYDQSAVKNSIVPNTDLQP